MSDHATEDVTELLHKWNEGDEQALDQLMTLVYDELRWIAHRHLRRERPGHTLQTSALVHEAYLRLVNAAHVNWQDRAHFFAIAANVMRRVLVEEARKRNGQKRGGGGTRVSLDDAMTMTGKPDIDLLALNEALEWLAQFEPRQSKVVEMRFFGGLTIEETAITLCVSADTVKSDWGKAKLWLMRRLSGEGAQDGSGAI